MNNYSFDDIENGLQGTNEFRDPNSYLIESSNCNGCKKEGGEEVELKTCSRCKVVKYCSKDCQRGDFNDHKAACKKIGKLTDQMDNLWADLQSTMGEELRTYVGNYWGLVDPRDYCRARFQLADEIYEVASKKESKPLYEVALSHFMELMRLIHGDNMGIRDKAPFVLLNLDRDQDAYDFIKWWETIDPLGRYDWGNPPPSQEGDWMYLRGENILEDIFAVTDAKPEFFPVAFLAALILIKARIVLRLELLSGRLNLFKKALEEGNATCQKLLNSGPVMDKIEKFIYPYDSKELTKQKEILVKYIDMAEKLNKYFLKSVVKPSLVLSFDPPPYIERGTTSEVYYLVKDCARLYARNGILMRILRDKVGEDPTF